MNLKEKAEKLFHKPCHIEVGGISIREYEKVCSAFNLLMKSHEQLEEKLFKYTEYVLMPDSKLSPKAIELKRELRKDFAK